MSDNVCDEKHEISFVYGKCLKIMTMTKLEVFLKSAVVVPCCARCQCIPEQLKHVLKQDRDRH